MPHVIPFRRGGRSSEIRGVLGFLAVRVIVPDGERRARLMRDVFGNVDGILIAELP
jgi:hypothetical protein